MKFIKYSLYLILFLTILPLLISGQSNTFSNIYCPQNIAAIGRHILVTDSGYIAGGVDIDSTTGKQTLVLLFLDTNGNIINLKYPVSNMVKYYPGTAGSLIQTTENKYAWAGQINNFIKSMGFLILLDSCLDFQWEQNYALNNDTTYSYLGVLQVKQTYDSGYVLIGDIDAPGQYNTDILLIKTDGLGNKTWQKTYNFIGADRGWNIIQTPDHGFLIGAGGYIATQKQSYTGLIIKTDSLGNEQWRKSIGSQYNDWYCVVANAPDGNFIIGTATATHLHYPDVSFRRIRILKINQSGAVLWDKNFGSTEDINSLNQIIINDNEEIIATGFYCKDLTTQTGDTWGWILKTNSNGDSLWMREHYLFNTNASYNRLYDIKPTPDGGYILCGEADSFPVIPQSIWVLKVDSLGCVVPGCHLVGLKEVIMPQEEILLYPNPATTRITLRLPSNLIPEQKEVRVFNSSGQEVLRQHLPAGDPEPQLDIFHLPAGIYYLRVIHRDISTVLGRFVKI